jgi:hypothetical protein
MFCRLTAYKRRIRGAKARSTRQKLRERGTLRPMLINGHRVRRASSSNSHQSPLQGEGRPISNAQSSPSPTVTASIGEPVVFRAANRVAAALGVFQKPLSAEKLIALARRRTGLTDFGEQRFEKAFEVLLQSFEAEAKLNAFGWIAARWDMLRFLTNLLVLRNAERNNPDIRRQPIERPLFITGMPRSGTTFLHSLLSRDPSNLVVRCWETIYPGPGGHHDRLRSKVDRHLAGFAKVAPDIRIVHPITADSPQECTEITAHIFSSFRFDTTHHIPSYREWMDDTGQEAAYRFHKCFLQHLQHRHGTGRWVLKCPDHVFALDALRSVYPDARIVVMHRDPLEVLPSVARLTEVLRRPFTRAVDRREIGCQVSERWARGAEILVGARASSDTLLHVGFRSLVRDPLRCISEIYERFGLTLSGEAVESIRHFLASQADESEARVKWRLEDYGLDPRAVRKRYHDYRTCFEFDRAYADPLAPP